MLIDLFQGGINVFDVRLVFDDFIAFKVQNNFGHSTRRAIARALKDHVLHLATAQMFDALLPQNPGDRVGHIALAAAVRSDNSSYAVTSEDEVSMIRKGLEARNFEAS